MYHGAIVQKLERERDEWKAKYIDLKSQLTQTQGCVTISRNGYVQELERELAEAREVLREIRDNEVNPEDEADSFLRDHAPSELSKVREQRDRLAVALQECREDSVELLGERDWWQNEPRLGYQKRYQDTRDNVTRADEALAAVKGEEQ
jgi:uncharacterized coiled-coil DUF342 family protein